MGRGEGGGLDLDGVGEILGIVGGAASGAALAINPPDLGSALGAGTDTLVAVGLGGIGGFLIARYAGVSPLVGALGGAGVAYLVRG